jgi:hypothetical protein
MPILGTVASQFSGKPFSSFESIATATVGAGGESEVEFASIPSTFTHLQLRGVVRTNRNDPRDALYFRYNGDTGSNYSWHWMHANGAGYAGGGSDINVAPTTCWTIVTSASQATGGVFANFVVDILDYKNTNKNKVTRSMTGFEPNSGDGRSWFISTLWKDTSAISNIYIKSPYGGTMQQHSQIALYGIRG